MSEKYTHIDKKSWHYRLQNYVFSDEPKNSCEYIVAIVKAIMAIVLLPFFVFVAGFLIASALRGLVIIIISNLVITGIIIGGFVCLFYILFLFFRLENHINWGWFCKKIKYFN